MKKNKKHKFSLIELFCIIIIVSLFLVMIILAVFRVINESKVNRKLALEEMINSSCDLYIYQNRDKAPKTVGDSVNISLKTLKEAKFLSKHIYNSKKESCMENSYVRVYKLNPKEYSYLTYLYCGNEKVKEVEEVVTPTINILFIDGKNDSSNNLIFNNINESRIYIDMVGGEDSFGRDIELYTYEVNIYMATKSNPDMKEYYSSGVINANKKYTYTIDKKIMSYINASDATSIKVVVKATNTLGGVSEVTSIAQADK